MKKYIKVIALLAIGLMPMVGWGQQVIGSFSYMNGGFEGQVTGALGTSVSATLWTRQSQAGATSSIVNTSPRSGSQCATVTNVATVSRGLQSPQLTPFVAGSTTTASTAYVVQFYVKNAATVASFQGGVTTNGTANPAYSTAATLAINASWSKQTLFLTTTSATVASSGLAIIGRSAAGSFDIDDVVIYSGNFADISAPNSPNAVTVNNPTTSSLDVSWGAASGGIDGGGYVVVRYSVIPNADNDPNQNGIYAVGNTHTNGTGSLTGTIRYIGLGLSFTDNVGLSSGTQYWYKVYTVDKAFNYSTESSGNGTTSSGSCSAPTIQANGISFSNVTSSGMKIDWANGNGTNRAVFVKETSGTITNPINNTTYSASTDWNSKGTQLGTSAYYCVYNGSGTTVTLTNLASNTAYYVQVFDYNCAAGSEKYYTATATNNPNNQTTSALSNSSSSDIIRNTTFTEPTNIAYGSYQSTNIVNDANSLEVAKFDIRDGGVSTDADAFGTSLTAITFTVANWANIRKLAIYDGTTEISEVAVSSGSVAFSGLTGLTATDGSSKTFTLRASFNTAATDNQQLSFTVNAATADVAGSTFATANAGAAVSSTTGDANRIEVTATKLDFTAGHSTTVCPATNFATPPIVTARDANNNTDLDFVSNVTITNSGSLSMSNFSMSAVAGVAGFSTLQFTQAGVVTLSTTNGGSITNAGPTASITIGVSDVTGQSANAGNAQVSVAWTNPICYDEIMIVAKPTSSISGTPTGDGSAYTANSLSFTDGANTTFDGTGKVVYKGAASPEIITSLSNGTIYYFKIFTRKGTVWSAGVEISTTPVVPPCMSESAFTATPTGWAQTSITYVSGEANFASNNGELTTLSIANPASLTFDLRRTTNANAKTLYVEVSTTTQNGSFTTLATYNLLNTTDGGTTACSVDLSAYTSYSTVFLKFRKSSATTSPWYLDNVNVFCGTPCTPPTTQATTMTFSSIGSTTMSVGWTRGTSPGDAVLVVGKASSVAAGPANGTPYTGNAAFGSGTACGGGNAVFSVSGTSVSVTNLSPQTQYYFNAYEYTSASNCFNIPALASSQFTLSTEPTAQASGLSATPSSPSQIDLSWTAATFPGSGATTKGYVLLIATNPNTPSLASTDGQVPTAGANTTIVSSTIGLVTTTSSTGLLPSTTYNYLLVPFTWDGTNAATYNYLTTSAPTATAITPAPAPEINVKQGSTSYASGGSSYDFGSVAWGASSSDITFTIENIGTANLTISTSLGSSGDYSVIAQPTSPVSGLGSTTFTVRFTPTATGVRNGTITIINNDTDEGTYILNLTGNGTTSNLSDIVNDAGYGLTSNAVYTNWQSASITNAGTGAGGSVGVFKIIIRDGGASASDADNLPTILNAITFSYSGTANTIRSAALFTTSNALIGSSITAGANSIVFTSLSGANVTATDNGTCEIILRVTFNNTVTDNEQLVFSVTNTNVTAAGSNTSSLFTNFAAASSASTGDLNRIEVSADRLGFVQQPSTTSISANMTPVVTVEAKDVNGNRDTDYLGTVAITSTGTLSSSPQTATLSSGIATFNTINHTVAGLAYWLTATLSPLTSATSNTFDIASFAANSYRSTGDGTWSGATWEVFTSGWVSSSAPPTNTSNIVYIRNNISSNGSISPANIVIENGGTLTFTASSTVATSLDVKTGGTLQVNAALTVSNSFTIESGGRMNINYSTASGISALWNGTEDFQNGSIIEIQNWNYGTGGGDDRLIQNPSIISTNTDGYYFGNLIISGGPTAIFVMSEGSQTINLCKNNFTVSISGVYNVAFTNSFSNITVGGNVVVTSGQLSIAATTTGDPVTTVLGNIESTGGTINLNQTNSGNATSTVQLKGNLNIPSGATLNCTDVDCKIVFSKSGIQTISIAGTLGTNVNFEVGNGSTTRLINQNLNLSNVSNSFTVSSGGILEFNGYDILGSGVFTLNSFGTLKITSANGVNASGNNTGNVQNTGTRTFSQSGYYHYVESSSPQSTGTAMTIGSTAKRIIIEKTNPTDIVNLTQSTGTTDKLEIIQGIFIESTVSVIVGSGNLIMSGGEYRMSLLSTTLPQLTGIYTLSGGTIHLNGDVGTQTLKGGQDYYSLTFSGGGNKLISSAITNIGNNATLNQGLVTIKDDNTILDLSNSTFSGNAGLTMTNASLLRMSLLNNTLPQLEGNYTMAGGTIEFYGSSSSQTHSLRGTDGSGNNITYNNIELNSNGANVGVGEANVVAQASFILKGIMNVNSPACFKIASTYTITELSASTFNLQAGATLKYGGSISSMGATGNIQTTNRNFPNTASYGFVGSGNQTTGTGLPASMINMYIDKSNTTSVVTLTNSARVSNSLFMMQGHINTAANILELGASIAATGALNYTTGYVIGKMQRWFNGTNSGISTGLFPLGFDDSGLKNRSVKIEYTTAASTSGNLILEWIPIPMGTDGLTIVAANTGGCLFDVSSSSSQGYWKIDNSSGALTDGNYTITCTGEGISCITDLAQATLLKRVGIGNWTCPGTHIVPGGTLVIPEISRSGVSGWSNFGIGTGDPIPLPIQLLSFTANCVGQSVHLNWATASEINNEKFTIERSTNGLDYSELASVKGAGNSNRIINYEFIDNKPENTVVYYQIRQKDYDGMMEIFGPVAVQCSESINDFSIISVVPENGNLTLTYTIPNAEKASCCLYDGTGKRILCLEQTGEMELRNLVLPALVGRGIYFITLTDGNQMLSKKVFIP